MKPTVYQFWNGGDPPSGALYGLGRMRAYAERIGAEHRFLANETLGLAGDPRFFDSLRPLFDAALPCPVLYADLDVIPALDAPSIFDEPCDGVGLCEEPHQPAYREKRPASKRITGDNDQRWADLCRAEWGVELPRDEQGRVRVFNAGVILFGRIFCLPFTIPEYIETVRRAGLPDFYTHDQPYIHAAAVASGSLVVLDQEWNRQAHMLDDGTRYDGRTEATRFVHCQLPGKNGWTAERYEEFLIR